MKRKVSKFTSNQKQGPKFQIVNLELYYIYKQATELHYWPFEK